MVINSLLLLQTFLLPLMRQLLLIQWRNSFEFLSWNLQSKVVKKIYSSPPFLGRRMKLSRCSTGGFSNSKRIPRASPTWKLPTGIFVCWKVLQHSTRRFCNESLQNLETHTLCWMCTTFPKSWNWLMHTMKPVL